MMDREVSNILIDSRDLSNTKNPLFNNSNLKFSNRSILNVQNFDVCIHRTIYSFEFFHFYRSQQKHPFGPGKTIHTHRFSCHKKQTTNSQANEPPTLFTIPRVTAAAAVHDRANKLQEAAAHRENAGFVNASNPLMQKGSRNAGHCKHTAIRAFISVRGWLGVSSACSLFLSLSLLHK